MAKRQELFVLKHGDDWAVSKPHAERASGIFDTQLEAIERAREISDGGTIHIQSRHGKFRHETPFDE